VRRHGEILTGLEIGSGGPRLDAEIE